MRLIKFAANPFLFGENFGFIMINDCPLVWMLMLLTLASEHLLTLVAQASKR